MAAEKAIVSEAAVTGASGKYERANDRRQTGLEGRRKNGEQNVECPIVNVEYRSSDLALPSAFDVQRSIFDIPFHLRHSATWVRGQTPGAGWA
jgi:hypothetical protein